MHTRLRLWFLPCIFIFSLTVSAALTSQKSGLTTHIPLSFHTPTYNPTIFPVRTTTPTSDSFSTHAPFRTHPHPGPPGPTRTRSPDPQNHRNPARQSPIIIFFEALCGVAVLVLFLALLRCCYSYRKTPDPDRVSGIINRHRLHMELEELQRRPPARRYSIQNPAPPYLPRPPSYLETPPTGARALQADYEEIPVGSPPDSPASSHTSSEAAHELVPAPSHALSSR